jgi:hypothetical protein
MAQSVISTQFLALSDDGVALAPTVSPYPHVIRFVVEGAGALDLELRKIHPDNAARAVLHGLVQKVSDRAAKKCDPKTGKPAPVGEKFAAMKTLVDHLNSGSADWSLRAAPVARVDWEVEDLVTARKDLGYVGSEAGEAKIRGWKPAERAAVSLQDNIRERINELRAERAKVAGSEAGVAALLAGLEDAE